MTIKIKNLRLRTILGIFEWERKHKQDIIINTSIEFDGSQAAASDSIEDTLNYKSLTKKIITLVESSEYFLIEKLAQSILDLVMESPLASSAHVEIDKPQALRFSDSVSVSCSAIR